MESTNSNSVTTFNGPVNNSPIQVGNINSTQNNNHSTGFPYEDVERVLQKINEYRESFGSEFGDSSEEFARQLDDVTKDVQEKKEPSVIKKGLGVLKELAIGVSGSLIASGIVEWIRPFL